MTRIKNIEGAKLFCIWCGREVVVSNLGTSGSAVWCCARPMTEKSESLGEKANPTLPKKRQSSVNKFKGNR